MLFKQPNSILVNEKSPKISEHSSPLRQSSASENNDNSRDSPLGKQDKAKHEHNAQQDSTNSDQMEHKTPDRPYLAKDPDGYGHAHDHEGHKERSQSLESSKPTVAIPSAMSDLEGGSQISSLSINHKDQPEEPSIAKAQSNIPRGSGIREAASSSVKPDPDSTVSDITSTPFYTVDSVKTTGIKRTAAQPSQMSKSLSRQFSGDATSEEIDKMCPCALLGHACTKGNRTKTKWH